MSVPSFYEEYAERLKLLLPTLIVKIPNLLIALAKIEVLGGHAYLVGGTSRDLIYDAYVNNFIVMPEDIDIEVFGLEQAQLERILNLSLTGNNFPVYNTNYEDIEDRVYDVQWSLPRRERKVGHGHNGFEIDVAPHMSLFDAAQRRDLTINSIMISLTNYTITDNFYGIQDLLTNKIADCVSVETFKDDPLRVLRAARFIARYDLVPTIRLIQLCSEMTSEWLHLTAELKEKELSKLFAGHNLSVGLSFLKRVGWLQLITYHDEQFKINDIVISDQTARPSYEYFINLPFNREIVNWAIFCTELRTEEINGFFKYINPAWNSTTVGTVMKVVHHGKILLNRNNLDDKYIARYIQYNCKGYMFEVLVYLTIMDQLIWTNTVPKTHEQIVQDEIFPIITGDDILEYTTQGPIVGVVREYFVDLHIKGIVTSRLLAYKMIPSIVNLIHKSMMLKDMHS